MLLEGDPKVSAYSVVVPALPGCTSIGSTLEEALANGREATALYTEDLVALGEPIPADHDAQAIRVQVAE